MADPKPNFINPETEKFKVSQEGRDFELEMIKYILLLNPENQKLSEKELNRLIMEEYNEAHSEM